jgi:hypothetical protein
MQMGFEEQIAVAALIIQKTVPVRTAFEILLVCDPTSIFGELKRIILANFGTLGRRQFPHGRRPTAAGPQGATVGERAARDDGGPPRTRRDGQTEARSGPAACSGATTGSSEGCPAAATSCCPSQSRPCATVRRVSERFHVDEPSHPSLTCECIEVMFSFDCFDCDCLSPKNPMNLCTVVVLNLPPSVSDDWINKQFGV